MEIPPLLASAVCFQDLLTSSVAVSEYSVYELPVSSKTRKDVQTAPRRTILSRVGFPFPTHVLQLLT